LEIHMIVVKVREAMERWRRQTGQRMTYRQLSVLTGLSVSTLQSVAARKGYNPTLDLVDRIATALNCPLPLLLEQIPNASEEVGQKTSPLDLSQAAWKEQSDE
jgi:transcriptional regulator with XRE-family HTH domain